MQKTYLLLLILFFPVIINAQINSGEVIYKVKIAENKSNADSLKARNPSAYGYFAEKDRKVRTTLPYLNFQLEFNKQESTFHLVESMETDINRNIETAVSQVRGDGIYYTDISKNLQLHQFDLLGDLWLIENKLDTIQWKVHKEIKDIAGYKTQKATATIPLNHIKKGEVTAWFTAEIPFQFGPIGVSNLPGLILEYQIQSYIYYADKIKLNKKEKKIKEPTKGERATEIEMVRKTKEKFFDR